MRSVAMVLVLVLAGCGSASESTPAPLATERVVISPLGVSLSVPPGYAVYPWGDDRSGAWVVDMNPVGRQPHRITLDPAAPETLERPRDHGMSADCPWVGPETARLGQGSSVSYYSSTGCGGSGGIVASLAGLWQLGERRLLLSCTAQAEPVFGGSLPDPTGCLAQLRSARAVPVSDDPVRLGPSGIEQRPLAILPILRGSSSATEPAE